MYRLHGNAVHLALFHSGLLFHPVPSSENTILAKEITTEFLSWTGISSLDDVVIVGEHT